VKSSVAPLQVFKGYAASRWDRWLGTRRDPSTEGARGRKVHLRVEVLGCIYTELSSEASRHAAPNEQPDRAAARTRHKQRAAWRKEAAEREWRVFLTAKFDRTWKAMIRFRAKVGAARFRELMAELPSTIENIGSSDQRTVADSRYSVPNRRRVRQRVMSWRQPT